MGDYFSDGARRAHALPNRGPLEFTEDGQPHPDILEAYWRYGFYVLDGVLDADEVECLVADFDSVMARAPAHEGAELDARGRPSIDREFERATFQFARPLSDPMGATDAAGGRYPVKMTEFEAPPDAPEQVVLQISGSLQMMDANLRLYGHPGLLRNVRAARIVWSLPYRPCASGSRPGRGRGQRRCCRLARSRCPRGAPGPPRATRASGAHAARPRPSPSRRPHF